MLTIGKLAAQAGATPDALRFYEREGLIAPSAKSRAGYRLYEQDAVQRLRFIHHAKQCGFTLAEIQELLAIQAQRSACCSDVRRKVVEKKLQLEARIKAMTAMSKALDVLVQDCGASERPVSECPILGALARAEMAMT
jgi:DNA-binding transcriptional MerR regulator